MEEGVSSGQVLDDPPHTRGLISVPVQRPPNVIRNGYFRPASLLGPHERCAPGIGQKPLTVVPARPGQRLPDFLLLADSVDRVVGGGLHLLRPRGDEVVPGLLFRNEAREERLLGCPPFVSVQPLELAGHAPVVTFDWLEGVIRNAAIHQSGRRTQKCVAELNVGVEEGERLAGFDGLQPEAELAEFDRHRVHVDAVEATAHDIAKGRPNVSGARLVVPGTNRGQPLRHSAGGGQ